MQNSKVIWEIHAENKQSAIDSFAHLAWALSTTQEEKIELERMKKGEDQTWYQKQLIQYVKEKLLRVSSWFLLFDDVKTVADIQYFLPTDEKVWGTGNILITTRNSEIGHNGPIKQTHVVIVEELTPQEKLDLFTRLYEAPVIQVKPLKNFLAVLPSFPLDIELAANYIKNTKSSYEEYLQCIQDENSKIKTSMSPLSSETNRYAKTRQGIVACAVERMLWQHKDFAALLLLVSMIGHKNIPKNLLKKCTTPAAVDQFIQQMCQSSLLSSKKTAKGCALSIHGSTQESVFHYLMNILTAEEKQKLLDQLTDIICDYCEEVLEELDYSVLQTTAPHVLNFSRYIPISNKIKINFQLGCLYYHLGDYSKAKMFFDETVLELKNMRRLNKEQRMLLLKILVYRGAVDTRIGNFEQAKKALEKSLQVYDQFFSQDQVGLALTLMYYGRLLGEMGFYEAAIIPLKRSLMIYTKYYGDKHPKTAWVLFRLGEAYSWLGQIEQAKACYNESFKIYQEKYGRDHRRTLWIQSRLGTIYETEGNYKQALLFSEKAYATYKEKYQEDRGIFTLIMPHLGDTYRRLGLYKKALLLLDASQKLTSRYYGEDNTYTQWCASFLGRLYVDMGYYDMARQVLEKSLAIHKLRFGENYLKTMIIKRTLAHAYVGLGELEGAKKLYQDCFQWFEKFLGRSHPEYARLLYRFGYLCLCEKDYMNAENFLKQALHILEAHKHAETDRCYEYLGDLYAAQGKTIQSKQAYYNAFCLTHKNFPKISEHMKRLTKKITLIQYCTFITKSLVTDNFRGSVAIF